MKKEKGFTLIELLAVIVILAILMVIAVPKILNVIENTRKSAAESSIKLVKDAIKTQVTSGSIMGTNFTSDESGCYTFNFDDQTSGNAKELQLKNKENITGSIKYCNGKFSDDTLIFDNVKVEKGPTKEMAKEGETFIAKVYLNPKNLKEECTKNNFVDTLEPKAGCMRWYVFEETDKTYTMILDRNTTNTVAWNSSGNNSDGMTLAIKQLEEDTKNWKGNPHILSANDIAKITKASDADKLAWDSSKTYGTGGMKYSRWYYLDGEGTGYTGWLKQYANESKKSKFYWLFDYTSNCKAYGCETEIDGNVLGYWTTSPITGKSSRIWVVYHEGQVNGDDSDNALNEGIRPAITIDKSDIR